MKALLFLAAFFISVSALGQGTWTKSTANTKPNRVMADSVLIVPRDTGSTNIALYQGSPVGDSGRIAFFDGKFWGFSSLWEPLGSGAIDTTSLSSRIDQKLNISDTADMLSVYARSLNVVPTSRTLNMIGGSDITITGGTQNLSVNRSWTFNNTSTLSTTLGRGNTALASILLGANGNTGGFSYDVIRNVSGTNYRGTYGVSSASGGGAYLNSSNGTSAQDMVIRLIPGSAAPLWSGDGGANTYSMLHTNNHPAGNSASLTLSGATVLSTINFNSVGHYSGSTTRTLTISDLNAAPSSGSANYVNIQSTFTSAQTGNYWISGSSRVGGNYSSLVGTGGAHYRMNTTGNVNRIAFGLSGAESGSNTGSDFMLWRYDDAGNFVGPMLMAQRSNGAIGVNESTPGSQLDIRGVSSSTGAALRVRNSTPTTVFQVDNNGDVTLFNSVKLMTGSGAPEGAKTAPVGSLYLRTDGGANTTFYIKESGTGNTGWIAK